MKNKKVLNNWLLAVRPKTLPAALGPVVIGFAAALREGAHHLPSVLFAALVALLIQAGTNLVNDYSDYMKGTDREDRVGPVRVTQAGLISPGSMKTGMGVVLLLIVLFSIPLLLRGGIPILIIGVLSVLSGILYTAGPYPLGYHGLGDLFVFIFFGPVAVGGTYYVQTLDIHAVPLLAGMGPGLISVAILCVNNLRDLEHDRLSGKRTLPVMLGKTFGRAEYIFSMVLAALTPAFIALFTGELTFSLLAILILVPSIKPVKAVLSNYNGPLMNRMLGYTGKLLLLYSVLFSAGWQLKV